MLSSKSIIWLKKSDEKIYAFLTLIISGGKSNLIVSEGGGADLPLVFIIKKISKKSSGQIPPPPPDTIKLDLPPDKIKSPQY